MDGNKFDDSGVVDLTKNIMIMLFIGLFMIIIFVVFFHFYAKRRGLQAIQVTNNRVHEQQQCLDASFLKTIRVIQFDPKEFKEGLECAICLSAVEEGEIARILPKCDHAFHVECIDMWFHSHSTCPICRNPIIDQIESELEQDLQEESTNVLVEIDETNNECHQASSSEQASPSTSLSSSSSSSQTYCNNNRERPHLVIEIPPRDNIVEEDEKTPVSCSGIRSLKRILSNSARFNPFSPDS